MSQACLSEIEQMKIARHGVPALGCALMPPNLGKRLASARRNPKYLHGTSQDYLQGNIGIQITEAANTSHLRWHWLQKMPRKYTSILEQHYEDNSHLCFDDHAVFTWVFTSK